MTKFAQCLVVVAAVFWLAVPAGAIVIDANDSDWSSYGWMGTDPGYDGSSSGPNSCYDIDVVKFAWGGASDDNYYFYFNAHGPGQNTYQGTNNALARILIDADRNPATGGVPPNVTPGGGSMPGGVEYYLEFPMGTSPPGTYQATLYYWNGSSFQNSGQTFGMAFSNAPGGNYWFTEWQVPRTVINSNAIYWQAYFYQQNKMYDFAVGTNTNHPVHNKEAIPEPGSLILTAFGLLGLGWWKRRSWHPKIEPK